MQSQLPRNIVIAKAEASNKDQPRTLPWPSSQSSTTSSIGTSARDNTSKANESTRRAPSGSSSPVRVDGMISKDDLINSNPFAAASVSNGSVEGRRSMGSDNESEDCSRTYDESKAGADGKKQARRRKANRACSHCQKAHLTCDDCEYWSTFYCYQLFERETRGMIQWAGRTFLGKSGAGSGSSKGKG